MNKRIVVTGATGLIGTLLCNELLKRGYEITIVSRSSTKARKLFQKAKEYIDWSDSKGLERAINGSYGVINLAGAPLIGKRWNDSYKKILLESRVKTTQVIVNAIANINAKPKVFINGSAVGYYGMVPRDKSFDETAPAGKDFLAQICVSWEKEAQKATALGVRVVCIRTAIVLDKHEGAVPKMLLPFRFFIGGPIGNGNQWFPWVHGKDEVGIICFALENTKVSGPINTAAPDTVTNKTFSNVLGKILHRPSLIPVPSIALQMLFGEAAGVLTSGVAVSSKKIEGLGYTFQYPQLHEALKDILE